MRLKKFRETAKEIRPRCVHFDILPKGAIGRISSGIVDVPPGGVSLSDPHTQWRQVFFFLSGSGKLVLTAPDGKTSEHRIQKDVVAEIPYDTRHAVYADPDVPVTYLYVNDYSQLVK